MELRIFDCRRVAIVLAAAMAAFCFSSCATQPKKYQPPSNAKVVASTKLVKDDIARAHTISQEAKKFLTDAQKNADKISVSSLDLQGKAAALLASVPEAQKPLAQAILKGITEQQEAEGDLARNLAGAQNRNDAQEKHLTATDVHVSELEQNQAEYYANAQKLADDATAERNFRIAAEKQLTKEKILRWVWRIGGGLFVIGILVVIGLFIAGKISFAGIRAYLHL